MHFRTATLALSTLLCACTADGIQDGRDDDLPVDGKADGAYPAAELAAALRGANTIGERELRVEVHLSDSVAHDIVAHRSGPDGLPGTADDDPFDDAAELDAIDYVGPDVFDALIDFARDEGWLDPLLTPLTRLAAVGLVPGDRFGEHIALANDTLVVGAMGRDHWHGAIYLFERSGLAWQASGTIPPPAGVKGFTGALAADGDTIVATAYDDDPEHQIRAYVFERGPAGWTQTATLSSSDRPESFGVSVAIAGNFLAVGEGGGPANHVHVYRRTNGQWMEHEVITNPAAQTTQLISFGRTLALAGDMLVIGSPNEDLAPATSSLYEGSGAAYVHDLSGARWQGARRLAPPVGIDARYFGDGVSTDGDRIAVTSGGSQYAFVFAQTGSEWAEVARLDDLSGPVAIDGDTLVVGARPAGFVSLIATAGAWTQTATYRPAPPFTNFGGNLIARDGLVIAGAWGEGTDTGAIYSN